MDDSDRNEALRISLEWGPRRMMPFETRLAETRPAISAPEAAELKRLCGQVESAAWNSVAPCFRAHGMKDGPANAAWGAALRAAFPWISGENMASLWSQGCYYAWKDGELG